MRVLPWFWKYIKTSDKFTFQNVIVSEAHYSLQREEYWFIFFCYLDPSKQEGKVGRRVMRKSINKNIIIFGIIILLKSYIGTEAPVSYITRNNTGKRDWNSSLRHNSKRSFPTCFLSSKTYYSVSRQLCACCSEFCSISWMLSSQVFTCFKTNSIKMIRTSDWKEVRCFHVRCLNWLYLFLSVQ